MRAEHRLKLMVTIVDRGKAKRIAALCGGLRAPFHIVCFGTGTASSEILDILGLGETDKDVAASIVPEGDILRLQRRVLAELQLGRPGGCVSFAILLTGIGSLVEDFVAHSAEEGAESEVEPMEHTEHHSLIVAVVRAGFSGTVMEAARAAGASGGTVLHGRGIGSREAEEFFGITIQPEKEILMILVPRQDKQPILKAICNKVLQSTGEHVTAFALPVTDVMGLTDYDLMNTDK